MPTTPYASPGFLVGEFLTGYLKGAQQQALLRQQRAESLMQMAMHQAKVADDTADVKLAGYARMQSKKLMDEADKALHAKVGLWHLFSKVLGKGDVDPKDALEQNMSVIGQGAPAASQAVGGVAAKDIKPEPGGVMKNYIESSKPTQPPVLEGPQEAQGTVGPTGAGMRKPPSEESEGLLSTAPRRIGLPSTGVYARDEKAGIKQPEQETRKGAELIRVGPGPYDVQPRIDGVNVNMTDYKNFVQRMALSRAEREGATEHELAMVGARAKAELEVKKSRLDEWKQGLVAQGKWNDNYQRAYDKTLSGVDVDDKLTTFPVSFRNPTTGVVTKRYYYKDAQGRLTDQVAAEEDQEPTAMDAEIQAVMKNKGLTYDQAVVEWGNQKAADQETQRKIHAATLKNTALEYDLKVAKADLEKRMREGKLTRIEFIGMAHDEVTKWATGLQGLEPADKAIAIKERMLADFGVSWEEYLKSIGGDADKINDELISRYLKNRTGPTYAPDVRAGQGVNMPAGVYGSVVAPAGEAGKKAVNTGAMSAKDL